SVAGGQCTAGSRILDGYRAPYDAHITERLRSAGAVIAGKTNMDEFAMGSSTEHSAFGPTANPWALDRVPGGSSGGSAAAVAAYHVPFGLGTDTGGSIRQPAALCGVVGLKPTYGRVSRYGIVAFASSLDQIGPFGRDVRDAAALLHAVAGRDERDSTSAPVPVPDELLALPEDDAAASALRGKRLGLPREYFVNGMEPGVEARIREAVAALEAAGATVEEVSLPHTDYGLATYYIVAPAEASANLARYDGIRYGPRLGDGDVLTNYLATRGTGFGAEVKRRIMLGTYALSAGYYDAYYLKAQKVRTLIKGDFDALFAAGFDALVAPTSPTVAFPLGARLADPVAMYLSDACTLPVNMAGLPGLSVPCGLSEGLPVGLQLIGPAWSELELFRLGRGYEAITADAEWRRIEPTDLAAADDPAAVTPAERSRSLAAMRG
ncbi:MAG TPA: Asp-tRNA(Asn)/Glu-tRNA(Gln) amidotransferase subunit GatA, partial [Candidatus Limnocylindrales bacterium]